MGATSGVLWRLVAHGNDDTTGRWLRLAGDRDHLTAAITAVRLQAGRAAGDPDAVAAVSAAIRDLLTQVRRYQERTTDALLDAYQRDLGGD